MVEPESSLKSVYSAEMSVPVTVACISYASQYSAGTAKVPVNTPVSLPVSRSVNWESSSPSEFTVRQCHILLPFVVVQMIREQVHHALLQTR